MKRKLTMTLALIGLASLQAQKFEKVWETSGFESPESVAVYQDLYFVSNVSGQPADKNGMGFISKVDKNGSIITEKWAEGFNAPKGLGIYGSELFVADIDVVVVVDLNTGKIKQKLPAEGATFLNDIEISRDGTVYVTDTFGGNAIYRIKKGDIELWLQDEALDYPNGLELKDNALYVSTWGVVTNPETFGTDIAGKLLKVDLKTKEITALTKSIGNLDGLAAYRDSFIVSDWIAGGLMTVESNGKSEQVLNLNPGSADFLFVEKEGVVIIPIMLDGNLVAYRLKP